MAKSDPSEAGPQDIAKMSKVQKLAALLVILGPESAAQILKNCSEAEVESISSEMVKTNLLTHEQQMAVLREFTEVAMDASASVLGGVDYTRGILEKSLGLFRASDVIGKVAPTRTPVPAMQAIVEMEPREICNLLKQEQPGTIALVLSYISPERSGHVLSLLRPEIRDQVVERLAKLAPTPIEVVERLVEVLNRRAGGKPTRALSQTGGIKTAAEMLNAMDKNMSRALLVSLEERNPELGAAIRQKMFTFEDLSMLDVSSLQKILREVDMRDLAISLKTASDKLKQTLLSSISKRAAETVSEEISFMGALKLKDIEAAQMRIIDVVRRLETEGEIELDGGSKEAASELVA